MDATLSLLGLLAYSPEGEIRASDLVVGCLLSGGEAAVVVSLLKDLENTSLCDFEAVAGRGVAWNALASIKGSVAADVQSALRVMHLSLHQRGAGSLSNDFALYGTEDVAAVTWEKVEERFDRQFDAIVSGFPLETGALSSERHCLLATFLMGGALGGASSEGGMSAIHSLAPALTDGVLDVYVGPMRVARSQSAELLMACASTFEAANPVLRRVALVES